MKRLFFISAVLVCFQVGFSQETDFVYEQNYRVTDISDVDMATVDDHPMGKDIAARLYLLKDMYTYIEEGTPTNPSDKTIVVKPAIYYSINKLNRFYKKRTKSGSGNIETDKKEFTGVINKALIIYAEDTEEFEKVLKKARKPEQILEVYSKITLK